MVSNCCVCASGAFPHFIFARTRTAFIVAAMQDVEGPHMRLGNYFSEESISLDLKSRQRDGILNELIELIPMLCDKSNEKEMLFSALKEREELCSTGMGDGIAFPHARSAI